MNRRDFLLLRTEEPSGDVVLSCERLYMRYLDSQMNGTTDVLFARLADDLRSTASLRLTETSWLSCEDFRARFEAVVAHSVVRLVRQEPEAADRS